MTQPRALTVIPTVPIAQRAAAAMETARALASEHTHQLVASILETERLALEVANGGELYPAGIRSEAKQIAAWLKYRRETVLAIGSR